MTVMSTAGFMGAFGVSILVWTSCSPDAARGDTVAGLARPASQVLTHIAELDSRSLTPVAKAHLGLRLYREEMLHRTGSRVPGPESRGPAPAANPVTHDFVLARITRRLAETGADPA